MNIGFKEFMMIVPSALIIIGLIYRTGKLSAVIDDHEEEIKNLKRFKKDHEERSHEILKQFVSYGQFKDYKTIVCGKLDKITDQMMSMDNKRERSRDSMTTAYTEIKEHIGRVEEFMRGCHESKCGGNGN